MSPKRAFTLIELLIVVAIIAILAAIAVPNFLEAQTRSKVSRAQADMRSIATGLEAYYVDANRYPPGWIEIGNPSNAAAGGVQDLLHPSDMRLYPLTTPISYLSTIFQDPFLVGRNILPNEGGFRYWSPAHADGHRLNDGRPGHGNFNTPDLFIDVPGESTNYGGWVVLSAGPDGVVEHPDHQLPNSILHTYDPTNGTISEGEIWRFKR